MNHHCGLPKLTISEKNDAQRPSVHANMGSLEGPMEMAPADQQHDGIGHNDRHSGEDEHYQSTQSAALYRVTLGGALTPETDGIGELLTVLALDEERVGADEVRRFDVIILYATVSEARRRRSARARTHQVRAYRDQAQD